MFILRPFKTSLFTKDDIGTVEEVVKGTRLVDKGIEELTRFSRNAPIFEPERRKFLKHAAVLAGLYATGQLLKGCATVQEPVHFGGKAYGGWEAYLLTQDLVRGPRLLKHPRDGLPSESEHHRKRTGWNAVDFDVPIGTPTVPIADTLQTSTRYEREGGTVLDLFHKYGVGGYKTILSHLDDYAEIIEKGEPWRDIAGYNYRNQLLDKLKIVAFSGNTGIGPGEGVQPPHLHLAIISIINKQLIPPGGIDPFQAGIDAEKPFGRVDEYGIPYGGRPVFWDGKTEIVATRFPNRRKQKLQETLDTYPKRVRESDLENDVKEELLKRQNDPEALRDYLGWLVLTKHRDRDGKMNYRYPPGSLPYALMLEIFSRISNQEFIAMLPFISPFVKEVYQQANPDVRF